MDGDDELTARVVSSFADTSDPRLREVLGRLVVHLHAFARDVQLTQREWQVGIDFLRRVGDITDDARHEFILLSDVLGLSMLTVDLDQPAEDGVTESTVLGPFFTDDAPFVEHGGDLGAGAAGTPAWVTGRVTDTAGVPVVGTRVDVWEADDDGRYDVQYDDARTAGRGYLVTDDDGRFSFWCVRPSPYPIPDDGPVGQLLRAARRSPMRPSHLHVMVDADGFERLVTHFFVSGSPHLDDDAVFGVKDSLVIAFHDREPGEAPDGRRIDEPWCEAHLDVVLQRSERDPGC